MDQIQADLADLKGKNWMYRVVIGLLMSFCGVLMSFIMSVYPNLATKEDIEVALVPYKMENIATKEDVKQIGPYVPERERIFQLLDTHGKEIGSVRVNQQQLLQRQAKLEAMLEFLVGQARRKT